MSLFLLSFCSYSFSNKFAYDTTNINNHSMNLLWRLYSCGIKSIIINIQLPPFSIWNGVLVVEEAMMSSFLLSNCCYYFSNKLAYDTTHTNNYSMNLLQKSHSYGINTNSYIISPLFKLKWCEWCGVGNGVIVSAVYLFLLFLKQIRLWYYLY